MRLFDITNRYFPRRGFTLPVVLIVVAGLLILAVGLLLMATIERKTARSFVDLERANLAAQAGLGEVEAMLRSDTASDDFVILQSVLSSPIKPGREPAPHLFIARGDTGASPPGFTYQPLFSHLDKPDPTATLKTPELIDLTGSADQRLDFTALPYLDDVRVSWVNITDEKNRVVSRYAYWVEDLQSRVDPAKAGNEKGTGGVHARAAWPFPAPGLNPMPPSDTEAALDQIALFAIDPSATQSDQGVLGKTLIKNRPLLVTPDSQFAAAEIEPPLTRLTASSPDGGVPGDLADPIARAVERGLATGIRPYLEQPLVPFAAGISAASSGTPKLNLNELLTKDRTTAIEEMAAHVRLALPNFEQRKGGFPDDYIKTLAANALDYADEDNEATVGQGYRGLDGFPLVSEYVFRSTWENIRTEGGRKYIDLSTTVYVELWNMSNVTVEGQAKVSYENRYSFRIPPNPNDISLHDLANATHDLNESNGYRWFPAFDVKLEPNEYRVYKCGKVSYSFDAVSASEWIASPLILEGESFAARGSGYRMQWNGLMTDQSRGGIHRNNSQLRFPSTAKQGKHVNRLTIPGHSHTRGGSFVNNMGDPRMSTYLSAPQDANVYPQNYSPNRRNIREGSVYDGPTEYNVVYGRVIPSEWPDGGHDSPFGSVNVHGLKNMTSTTFRDDHRIEPDDPMFYNQLPDLTSGAEEASTRLSNRGRYFSSTELGRAYDPVMWRVRTSTTNSAGNPWGDVLTSSTSSADYGGGNSLRIGRPEHARFDIAGQRASQLLDLFHTGISRSADPEDREGPVQRMDGHVNLNTASKYALRMLVSGRMQQDPEIRRFVKDFHTQGISRFPEIADVSPAPDFTLVANRIADAIIRSRPFASTSELANSRELNNTRVFGNARLFKDFENSDQSYPKLQWTDSAAEEMFAQTYEALTVRSRNFRIWVIGQAITPTTATNDRPEVLSEVRRAFTVFADPGERNADGSIDSSNSRLTIIHENDF